MRKPTFKPPATVLIVLGVLLLLGGAALFGYQSLAARRAEGEARQWVTTLREGMPPARDGVPEKGTDPRMPQRELEGENFVGILEVPSFERTLPIGALWKREKATRFPCRYGGSLYENNLILGGSDGPGQLDFVKQISNGDTVFITDLTGLRVEYRVTEIRQTKDVSTTNLAAEGELVLFARNTYSLDYTVIRCERN